MDCVISSDTVVFCAGGAISSTLRPGRFVPCLSCKSVPQQGQASRGMSLVSSATTLDLLPLPQPGLLFRFFFRRFLGGFGLPSLSHSGFFELGSLTCLLMSRILRPLLCSSCSRWTLASCSLSSAILLSLSSSRRRAASRSSRMSSISWALDSFSSLALPGRTCRFLPMADTPSCLLRDLRRHDRGQYSDPFGSGQRRIVLPPTARPCA